MQNTASFWPPRGGTAFRLLAGATLTVIDPEGTQVADLLAFNVVDIDEVVSSGRTLDHAESIRLTTGNTLFSNRSRKMLPIIEDTVEPPLSKGGDHISFRAEMDLVIGLAACSACASNGGSFSPIDYRIG